MIVNSSKWVSTKLIQKSKYISKSTLIKGIDFLMGKHKNCKMVYIERNIANFAFYVQWMLKIRKCY